MRLTVATAVSCLCFAATAGAAEDASSNSGLEEVIVTATRRAERLQDLPMSVTALTGVELEKRGAGDINDIVGNSPGLSNPAQGLGANNNIIIRGVATSAGGTLGQATVSFLLDDIDLNPGAVTFGTSSPRIVDVQRVEVLRGPQGTLFGAGSLSGAVRFISNRPDLDAFSGWAESTVSSTDQGGTSKDVSAVLNVPFIPGQFAGRLVAYYFNDAGWVDNPELGRRDINASHTSGARLTLSGKPADEVSVVFTAIDDRSHEFGSTGTYYYPQAAIPNYRYEQPLYSAGDATTDNHIYNLNTTWTPSFGTFISQSNYYYRVIDGRQDLGAVLVALGLATPADNPSAPSIGPNSIRNYSQEFRFDSNDISGFKFTAGAYYGHIGSNPAQIVTTNVPGFPLLLGAYVNTVQWQAAVYGSATYTLADRWDFSAGVRAAKDVVHFKTVENGLLAGANTPPNSENDNPVTPRATITFRQSSDLTWYVQAAKGYRVGGPNVTAGNETNFASYGPDSLWNFEIGSKVRLFNALSLNTSIYDIEWSNMQVGLTTPAGFNYIGNGGKSRIYGLEEEMTWRALSWLELGGTLSVNHGRTTTGASISRVSIGSGEPTAATINSVLPDYRLPGSPELQGSLYGEAQFHVAGYEAFVRLSGQYQGAAYTDFNDEGLKFGDFTTGNLRAGINFPHLNVTAFLNNFTNSTGATSALDASLFNLSTAYRTRPRTAGVTFRVTF